MFVVEVVTLLAKVQSTCCPPPGYGRGDNLILFFTTVQEMNGDIIKAKSAMNSCPLAAPSYSGFFPFLFSLSGGLFLLYREILEYFTITLQCHRIIVRDVGFDPRTDALAV